MRDHVKRLENMEKSLISKPLIVLARLPSGQEVEVSTRECVALQGDFIRVISGGSLSDLDYLLNEIFKNSVI